MILAKRFFPRLAAVWPLHATSQVPIGSTHFFSLEAVGSVTHVSAIAIRQPLYSQTYKAYWIYLNL